jgi:GDPmannose 4,6-dehydratase
MKKVLITGFTGQDGYLMASYLLRNTDNVIVCGIRRVVRGEIDDPENLLSNDRIKLIDLDITDQINVERVIEEECPDYFINLGANSFVGNSWSMPVNHMETNFMAVLYQLEAIKKHAPHCRYYNAGSSEQFGNVDYSPQDIKHPFKPRSPYGVSKCAAHHLLKVYRESYNLYAVQGILFNHEGIRRGEEFVTRKITKEVARINEELLYKKPKPLELGNLDAKRDWSDSEDFVKGIWLMLNQERGEEKDYVLASGETHSIRDFVEQAFKVADLEGRWEGEGVNEKYICRFDKSEFEAVVINPEFYRPAEVELLLGDSTPARKELGWEPKTSFNKLVEKMVVNDLKQYNE